MSQAIRYCVGGRWAGSDSAETIPCVNRYRHGEDCPDRTTEEVKCSGCEPRHATDGYLCGTCHRYLVQWLAAPIKGEPAENSLLFVHSWLKSQVRRECRPQPRRIGSVEGRATTVSPASSARPSSIASG